MQQIDVTQMFPVTLEKKVVPSYFSGPDIQLEIIKPKQSNHHKMPLYYSIHGGGMVLGSPVVDRPACGRVRDRYSESFINFNLISSFFHLFRLLPPI